MVFSSVPLYLDPPNWQQHPNQQLQVHQNNHHDQNQHHHLLPPPQVLPQPPPHQLGIGGGGGGGPGAQQIRPNSMAERARMAKIPPPEAPLKCPRCDSTNTKFCYFNNYSLTQPRHFCKTCRRYWTRGGALRNVPVGGGCRRNKRTSSKSSTGGGAASSSKSSLSSSPSTMIAGDNQRHHNMEHLISHSSGVNMNSLSSGVGNSMSFMASLQNIAQLGGMSNMGLTFGCGPMHTPPSNTNPLGGLVVGGGHNNNNLEYPQHHQQQQHVQFPNFLGGFEIPGSSGGGAAGSGLYSNSFQNVQNDRGIGGGGDDEIHNDQQQQQQHQQQEQEIMNNNDMLKSSNSSMMSPVKMEESGQQQQQQQGLNLAKQLMMGISSSTDNGSTTTTTNNNNNQFWGGNMTNNAAGVTSMWTDLSGLHSSSTSHLL